MNPIGWSYPNVELRPHIVARIHGQVQAICGCGVKTIAIWPKPDPLWKACSNCMRVLEADRALYVTARLKGVV